MGHSTDLRYRFDLTFSVQCEDYSSRYLATSVPILYTNSKLLDIARIKNCYI